MAIKILQKLKENGELQELLEAGLLSTQILNEMKIFYSYEDLTSRNKKKTEAVKDISKLYRISERSIYRIIKKLKTVEKC